MWKAAGKLPFYRRVVAEEEEEMSHIVDRFGVNTENDSGDKDGNNDMQQLIVDDNDDNDNDEEEGGDVVYDRVNSNSDQSGLPFSSSSASKTRMTTTRRTRTTCRVVLKRLLLTAAAYSIFLVSYVHIFSKSHPSGYDKSKQRWYHPLSLLLLPLTPWVRKKNKDATPVLLSLLHQHDIQQLPTEEVSDGTVIGSGEKQHRVVQMPLIETPSHDYSLGGGNGPTLEDLQMHMASELSGCDPKFILQDKAGNKFLFKPNKDPHKVYNELLAYVIGHLTGFDRIPPTWPAQVPLHNITQNVHRQWWSLQSMPGTKCNFDLDEMDQWIHNDGDGDDDKSKMMIGTLQLMIEGISKRPKFVNRLRNKIGRWTDVPITTSFAQREIGTRTMLDWVIGNYDRYNNDFVQSTISTTTTTNGKILAYIDQGSFASSAHWGWNIFQMNDTCKFYWRPVQKLRELDLHQELVTFFFQTNPMTQTWLSKGLIGWDDHPTIQHVKLRVDLALDTVDQCVQDHGHEYVFLH